MEKSKKDSIILKELEIENKILRDNMKKKDKIIDEIMKLNKTKEKEIIKIKNEYSEEKEKNEILAFKLEQIYNSRSYKLIQRLKRFVRR